MLDKLKELAKKAKSAVTSTAVFVGDLNGDGKVDQEDMDIAAAWARKAANSVGDEAVKLGKNALQSDMAKDAAAGAAVGAVIAIPIPFVGPPVGAALGAAVGVYKNITHKNSAATQYKGQSGNIKDTYAELLKLDDLRKNGIVNDTEFEVQKKKLLAEF